MYSAQELVISTNEQSNSSLSGISYTCIFGPKRLFTLAHLHIRVQMSATCWMYCPRQMRRLVSESAASNRDITLVQSVELGAATFKI